MYKKILVVIDGSEISKLVLVEVVCLVKVFQSIVCVVYIVDSFVMLFDVGYYDLIELCKLFIQVGIVLLVDIVVMLIFVGLQQEMVLVEMQNVGEDVVVVL